MANRMSTELRPSPQGVHVGIVGASGLVGDIILSILAERQFPVASLRLFASARGWQVLAVEAHRNSRRGRVDG
jgi:aspartate-semialdehyde dehydrogenase